MIVYKITNTVNGKIYIGKTKHDLDKRWYKHCGDARRGVQMVIHRAIVKYGEDAFTREILALTNDPDLLNQLEIEFIACLQAENPEVGYNRSKGGDGGATYNLKKTHCIHGHCFDAKNTIFTLTGSRQCKACKIAACKKLREIKRQETKKEKKTHCKYGHPFDEENTIWVGNGRFCKTCGRIRTRNRQLAHGQGLGYLSGEKHYNRKKTHCKRGHPYSTENTRITPKGTRVCRTCMKIYVGAING